MSIQKTKAKKQASPKELKPDEIWNDEKLTIVKNYILARSKKQSPGQRLKNELLAIKFRMQDYLEQDKMEGEMRIVDFVRLYLKVLNMKQKDLATAFGMKDSNLYKYFIGERKLNSDIVLKLSHFTHTNPELWFHIEVKNELNALKKTNDVKKYAKYDYKNLLIYTVNEK